VVKSSVAAEPLWAFGDYCYRPSYFVPFFCLRRRGGRLEVAGPIHLWLRLARDQPSLGFGLAGTPANNHDFSQESHNL